MIQNSFENCANLCQGGRCSRRGNSPRHGRSDEDCSSPALSPSATSFITSQLTSPSSAKTGTRPSGPERWNCLKSDRDCWGISPGRKSVGGICGGRSGGWGREVGGIVDVAHRGFGGLWFGFVAVVEICDCLGHRFWFRTSNGEVPPSRRDGLQRILAQIANLGSNFHL